MQEYKTLVFTEETIKEAKSDRATLNKLKTAIDDERKRIKKLCLAPYNDFETKVKEITALIDEPIQIIDIQIREVEEAKKEEKRARIVEIYNQITFPEGVTLEKLWDSKWLNAGTSLKSIKEDLDAYAVAIADNLQTLMSLPQFGFEAAEVYKETLDMSRAISEAKRMAEIQRLKEEAVSSQPEEEPVNNVEPEEPVCEEDPKDDEVRTRRLKISFEITANENQFSELNRILAMLKNNSEAFTILKKEEL